MNLPNNPPELVCPAGTPAALRTAVDAGADAVYCGFQNATNARNFPGLNFTPEEMEESVDYAHKRGKKVLLALNTFPPAGQTSLWKQAVSDGVRLGVDAMIVADIGVAHHIATTYPDQRLHLSVQAGAPSVEAIRYYCEEFGVKRVVLPRILSIPEIKQLKSEIPCEIETFIFGNQGLMAEGRCSLTNFVSGVSTNFDGVCSPPSDVTFHEDKNNMLYSQLGEFTIDCFSCAQGAGYPTICKGKYVAPHRNEPYYAFEEPISLNLFDLLPQMVGAGIEAFKIEGRQRSRAYIRQVVSAWRLAVDSVMQGKPVPKADLVALTEGQKETTGAFRSKQWR